ERAARFIQCNSARFRMARVLKQFTATKRRSGCNGSTLFTDAARRSVASAMPQLATPLGQVSLCRGRTSAWAGETGHFLTNSHVISLDPVDEAPLRPSQAEVEFTRLSGRPRVRLGELVYSSQRIAMDVSILRIIAPPDSGKLELCSTLPKN